MKDDDTNPLAGLDLEAWAAPSPPAGLADRAIARAAATDAAIAVVQRRRDRVKRRWWLAGGLTGALAAASAAFVVISHGPSDPASAGSGALVATQPQQLALRGVIANLDPGADVTWQRGGDAIHVAQRAGSATWKVERDQQLFVDVGAAVVSIASAALPREAASPNGDAVSIDASQATFRVETRMNLTDTRVVGVTAATAAAVALVTVIVYEGHVKVSGAGQTVIVERGGTVEVEAGKPPHVLDNVAGVPTVTAVLPGPLRSPQPPAAELEPELVVPIGEKIVIHDPRGSIRVAVDTGCPDQEKRMWPSGPATTTTTSSVSFSYTCHGIDKHGSIVVVKDPGFGVVMAPVDGTYATDKVHVIGGAVAARAQVAVNGTIVRTQNRQPWGIDLPYADLFAIRIDGGVDDIHYYIRRLTPMPRAMTEVAVEAGESPTIHDVTGRAMVVLTSHCPDKSEMSLLHEDPVGQRVITIPWDTRFAVGTHPYVETCIPEGTRFTGKITVVQDDGKAIGKVDSLADWMPPMTVTGSFTTPGTTVRVEGSAAATSDGTFTAQGIRTGWPGVLAVHFAVPGQGTHILVSRSGSEPSRILSNFDGSFDSNIDLTFKAINPELLQCVKNRGPGQMISFVIPLDGTPREIRTTVDDAASDSCLTDVMKRQRFARQTKLRYVSFALDPGCDAKALADAGEALMKRGAPAAALVKLDAAIDCGYSDHSIQLGFMAACDAKNVTFARKFWKRLTSDTRPRVLQICVRNGITEDQLTE